MYLDANNLYGWSMIQSLPVGDFKWEETNFDESAIINMCENQERG